MFKKGDIVNYNGHDAGTGWWFSRQDKLTVVKSRKVRNENFQKLWFKETKKLNQYKQDSSFYSLSFSLME